MKKSLWYKWLADSYVYLLPSEFIALLIFHSCSVIVGVVVLSVGQYSFPHSFLLIE